MKDLTLNQLEQTRLHVLNSVLEHQLPVAQAAEILGVSERHALRLLAAYWREGAAAPAHGNRGRKPRNAVSDDEANAVVQLASTTYVGANHTHLTELLKEREGIDLSRPTVRRILPRAGISSPRHHLSTMERARRQPQPSCSVPASMGPPPFGDGKLSMALKKIISPMSFNGATAFRRWKVILEFRREVYQRELQWGHRLSAMESYTISRVVAGVGFASMGPPPFGDGKMGAMGNIQGVIMLQWGHRLSAMESR